MGRMIFGVVAGYVSMAVFVMASLAIAWLALGPERVLDPGSGEVTALWSWLTLFEGFVAALFGGWIAAAVADRSGRDAVRALAAVVVVLGLVSAFAQMKAKEGEAEVAEAMAPVAEMSFTEAGRLADQPIWYSLALPAVGGLGVLFGGAIRTRKLG